jgi:hypothetical protein
MQKKDDINLSMAESVSLCLTAEGPPVRRHVRPVTPKNGCNLQAAYEMRLLCTDPKSLCPSTEAGERISGLERHRHFFFSTRMIGFQLSTFQQTDLHDKCSCCPFKKTLGEPQSLQILLLSRHILAILYPKRAFMG